MRYWDDYSISACTTADSDYPNCAISSSDLHTYLSESVKRELDKRYKDASELTKNDFADVSLGKTLRMKLNDGEIIELKNISGVKVNMSSMIDGVNSVEIECGGFALRNKPDKKLRKKHPWLLPKKVIFSGPATTIIWTDGTKTTVKCQDNDELSTEVGIAMCYLKKLLGNKGNYNNIFRDAMKVAEFQDDKKEAK